MFDGRRGPIEAEQARIALSYATERDPEAVALFHGGLYTHDFNDVFAAGGMQGGRSGASGPIRRLTTISRACATVMPVVGKSGWLSDPRLWAPT